MIKKRKQIHVSLVPWGKANAYAYAHVYANANAHAHASANAYAYAHVYANAYAYAYAYNLMLPYITKYWSDFNILGAVYNSLKQND